MRHLGAGVVELDTYLDTRAVARLACTLSTEPCFALILHQRRDPYALTALIVQPLGVFFCGGKTRELLSLLCFVLQQFSTQGAQYLAMLRYVIKPCKLWAGGISCHQAWGTRMYDRPCASNMAHIPILCRRVDAVSNRGGIRAMVHSSRL
jgi:hypothetical protein